MRFIILVSIVIFGATIAFGSPLVSFFAKKGTPVYEIARRGFLIFLYRNKDRYQLFHSSCLCRTISDRYIKQYRG